MSITTNLPSLPDTMTNPVADLRDGLLARLPGQIRRIVMYGSYARGEAHQDSDIDILVILKNNDSDEQNQARAVPLRGDGETPLSAPDFSAFVK